jgi:hypothetical protein
MGQEIGHLTLHGNQLVQLQIWVRNRQDFTGTMMFIDEHSAVALANLTPNFQDSLSLQHGRENKGGGGVGFIPKFQDAAQQTLRVIASDGLWWAGHGGMVLAPPM